MENFKEELKVQNRIMAAACVILAVFSTLGFAAEAGLVELIPVTGDSHWQSMWRGMISGASFGVLALMVFSLIRGLRALKDEKKLKKLYIEATDERMHKIWTSARASAMQIFLIFGLVAALVAGFFSMTISITLLVCMTAQALIGLICKIYYTKKY